MTTAQFKRAIKTETASEILSDLDISNLISSQDLGIDCEDIDNVFAKIYKLDDSYVVLIDSSSDDEVDFFNDIHSAQAFATERVYELS